MDKAVTYQKKVHASTQNLAEIRKFVSEHAKEHGFTPRQVEDIRLAVDEACTNIIKHAYNHDASKELGIILEFEDERMNIILTDNGLSFDENKYKSPDIRKQIKEKKRGGMGIHLMKNLMDEVTYIVKNQKNILRMCKRRN